MATTLNQAFNEYKSRLEITDLQESKVADRKNTLISNYKKELSLHPDEAKVIGSWKRNTMMRYLREADVDVMIILHYSQHKDWETGPGTVSCLSKFKRIAESYYPDSTSKIDQNCVTIKFQEFRIDVIPAFCYEGDYYKIPDTHKREWISTNPKGFSDLITQVNANMDESFVPIIKMVKGWNREEGWPIKSYHLECMLYHHYKSYRQKYTYNSTLKRFFECLPTYLQTPCYDPIYGQRIDDYFSAEGQAQAWRKARSASMIAKEAEGYGSKGHIREAIQCWESLFGEFFPSYG